MSGKVYFESPFKFCSPEIILQTERRNMSDPATQPPRERGGGGGVCVCVWGGGGGDGRTPRRGVRRQGPRHPLYGTKAR